jgi:hypothetical protein
MSEPISTDAPWSDEDAERALLSAIVGAFTLAENGDAITEAGDAIGRVQGIITSPESFWAPAHRMLWRAIVAIHNAGRPAGITAIRAWLRDAKDESGAADHLNALLGAYTSTAHVEDHAAIVGEMHRRRLLEQAGSGIRERLREGASAAEAARAIEHALASIHAPATSSLFEPADLVCSDTEAVMPWDVEGLFPSGCVTLLCSEPKCGKTTLLAHIVAAMLTGTEAVGLETRKADAVVWVSEEARATLRTALLPAKANLPGLHLMMRSHLGAIPWAQVVAAAARQAEQTKAAMLIIDTLSAWAGFKEGDENDAGVVESAVAPLKRIAAKGVTVVLVHHLSKSPDRKGVAAIRGSSALAGAMDGYLLLRKVGQAEDSTVRSIQGNGRGAGWAQGFTYERDPAGRLVRITDRLQVASAVMGKKILDYIALQPGCTMNVIHRELGGRRQTVIEAIRDLERQGRVRVQGDGTNGTPSTVWPA